MLVDEQERHTYVEMQIAATLLAAGAKGVEMPSIADRRRQFDENLNAEPTKVAPSNAVIREALGLSRAS